MNLESQPDAQMCNHHQKHLAHGVFIERQKSQLSYNNNDIGERKW